MKSDCSFCGCGINDDRITAEEIAELRTQPHDNHTLVRRILDALESAYAELARLSAQGGEVPEPAEAVVKDLAVRFGLWPDDVREIARRVRSAPPHPDTVVVSREAYRWIPVEESLPEDQEHVGFIVDCGRDDFLHGRVYGGSFNRRDWDERWGGFNTHGFGARASHWCRLPPILDAIRSGAQAQPATEREG